MTWVIVVDTWAPGYLKRLGWFRSKLANYSYRWQMVAAEWAEVRSRHKSLWRFLAERNTTRKLRRRQVDKVETQTTDYVADERYDHTLFKYLDGMVQCYEPKPFAGRMMVIRSSREPTGRFLDEKLGWTEFATGGVEPGCGPW